MDTAYTVGQAQIEILELNAEVNQLDKTDIFAWLVNKGVPVSVVTRLEDLWDVSKKMAGQTIHFGKIIFLKLLEFCKAHPHALIGAALGAAIGALISLVPFIGPMLAPLAAAIGAAYGFAIGSRLDYKEQGSQSSFEGLILTAKDFFKIFAELLTVVFPKLG